VQVATDLADARVCIRHLLCYHGHQFQARELAAAVAAIRMLDSVRYVCQIHHAAAGILSCPRQRPTRF
jgi:hypothetical protein